jgi:hypothetical protein
MEITIAAQLISVLTLANGDKILRLHDPQGTLAFQIGMTAADAKSIAQQLSTSIPIAPAGAFPPAPNNGSKP